MAGQFQKDDTFVVGLTMAGAVSAGAYTAGVLDFLMEALSEWEKAKGLGDDVPRHKVCIAAISGTSAGGVCAPLLCAALASGEAPDILRPGLAYAADVPAQGRKKGDSLPVRVFLPRLYKAWVSGPALAAPGRAIDFLSLQDLENDGPVLSALNASMLDWVGETALFETSQGQKPAPLEYISKRLHLFTTLGNVTGIPYKIEFAGAPDSAHGMLLHADRIHSVVQGVGANALESIWANQETPHITVDPAQLFQGPEANWRKLLDAALATCAFPLGMRARILKHPAHLWDKRLWPMQEGYDASNIPANGAYPSLRPDWPEQIAADPNATLEFINVDGGVANNEPFEYARWSIMADPGTKNEPSQDKADRAVIMIDPFPEGPEFSALSQGQLGKDKYPNRLMAMLKALPGLFVDQARFKTTELVEAADPDKFSRFLISPWGPADKNDPNDFSGGARAMACGGLGGFGGFVSEIFRAYDFQLGRRNCQRFLSKHFALPASNKLITATWKEKAAVPGWFKTPDSPVNGTQWCQIVPLTGTALEEVPLPAWPKTNDVELGQVRRRIAGRADKVVSRFLEEQFDSGFLRTTLKTVWWMFGSKASNAIADAVEKALKDRKQF